MPKMPFAAFYDYLRCEMNYSSLTVLSYRSDIEQFCEYMRAAGNGVAADNPAMITESDLRIWVAQMARDGKSTATILRKIQAFRALFAYLVKYWEYEHNPAATLSTPKQDKKLPDFVRSAELNSVLDSEPDPMEMNGDAVFRAVRRRLIVDLLYSTGMRAAELIGLRDAAVDTVRGELKVLGKRNKERIIPITDELKDMIDHYRRERTRVLGERGIETTPRTLIVREDGSEVYYQLVYREVRASLDGNVKATRRSPHVLRHSFATDMLNNGASLAAVQQLLGHKSLTSTQIYTHLSFSELQSNYQLAHPRAHKTNGG